MFRGHPKVSLAVFAPTPSASEPTATAVTTGLFRKRRNAYRMSCWKKVRFMTPARNYSEFHLNICEPRLIPKDQIKEYDVSLSGQAGEAFFQKKEPAHEAGSTPCPFA
jgi:hypothetical protein